MRALAPMILLVATAMAAAPPRPAAPVSTLALDTENRWVPFDRTPGNQIQFVMLVDGKPATAILDTGVSYSVMSRDYAERARLTIAPRGNAEAIGGAVPIGWAVTHRLALGGLTRAGGGISVVAVPAIATGAAAPVDLLIGRDLIGRYALEIDYDGRRFRLLPSGRLPFRGVTAPLGISRDRQVYQSEVTLGDRRIAPVIVDTGDGSQITLSAAAWQSAGNPSATMTSALSYGLGGPIETGLTILPLLRVGAMTSRNVELRIEGRDGFSQAIGMAGRIGSGFLEHYRVLLDPAAGRMVLSPGATADAPPLRSTSGLLLRQEERRLRVLHVMRGGPAEAAGWRAGELICSVDGVAIPADYRRSAMASWSIGAAGRRVALGMCDGTTRTLVLRLFY